MQRLNSEVWYDQAVCLSADASAQTCFASGRTIQYVTLVIACVMHTYCIVAFTAWPYSTLLAAPSRPFNVMLALHKD